MKRVALITYRGHPELDALDAPLPPALEAEGLAVEVVSWDDPVVDWAQFACAVFRSPWDYFQRPLEFAAWLDRAESQTRIFNPPAVVRWNLHKKYLLELAEKNVPTVPTEVALKGSGAQLTRVCSRRGWTDVVVKPAISAGAWRTSRFRDVGAADAQRHLDALLSEADALIQPFQPHVLSERELSIGLIDGELAFAVTKRSAFEQDREAAPEGTPAGTVRAEIGPAEATEEALALARAAVAVAWHEPLLYARVDMIRGPQGALQLMELEAFDPSLYLSQFPAATTALAKAIRRRVS